VYKQLREFFRCGLGTVLPSDNIKNLMRIMCLVSYIPVIYFGNSSLKMKYELIIIVKSELQFSNFCIISKRRLKKGVEKG